MHEAGKFELVSVAGVDGREKAVGDHGGGQERDDVPAAGGLLGGNDGNLHGEDQGPAGGHGHRD